MSFGFDLKPLISSIKKFGLINIPFVTKGKDGRVDVVAGYRRIMALRSLNCERVPCMDLSDSGLSHSELLLFNLYDNLATRQFNDVEKGMILNRLVSHVPKREITKRFMPLLKLPAHEPLLDIFLKLEEQDHQIRTALIKKEVSFQIIKIFIGLEPDSRSAVLRWISGIKLNQNQQKKFFEYLEDISIKEEKEISELLGEKQFLSILEDKKLNNPQKSKLILDLLRSRRFPLLVRSEKAFQKEISRMPLPDGVSLHHSQFFEDPDYRLEIVFRGAAELREKINFLSRLDGLERIGEFWQEDL
jgi:ParB-like chromosome segregation protein Spo0J